MMLLDPRDWFGGGDEFITNKFGESVRSWEDLPDYLKKTIPWEEKGSPITSSSLMNIT